MKLKSIASYRDGGTIHAALEDGCELFVDNRIGTSTRGALYSVYPTNSSERIADEGGLMAEYLTTVMYAEHAYRNKRAALRQAYADPATFDRNVGYDYFK